VRISIPSMPFKAVVFDFDGCLVDSAPAKYAAFFSVFPSGEAYRRIVAEVLRADPDGSRYSVIPQMADLMRRSGLNLDDHFSDNDRISAYGAAVLQSVAACPELPGAEDLLHRARQSSAVFISSNTPEAPLRDLVERRGWLRLVENVYGYPRRKTDTLREVVANHGGRGDHVLVVGDGVSDEASARENSCVFVAVDVRSGLAPAFAALETNRAQ
jgi:phosphoglycolate phosphatase-like HAD superfamily hydrolase